MGVHQCARTCQCRAWRIGGSSPLCPQPQTGVCLVPRALGNIPGGSTWLGGTEGPCLAGAGGRGRDPRLGSQGSRTRGPSLGALLSLLVTVGSRRVRRPAHLPLSQNRDLPVLGWRQRKPRRASEKAPCGPASGRGRWCPRLLGRKRELWVASEEGASQRRSCKGNWCKEASPPPCVQRVASSQPFCLPAPDEL